MVCTLLCWYVRSALLVLCWWLPRAFVVLCLSHAHSRPLSLAKGHDKKTRRPRSKLGQGT